MQKIIKNLESEFVHEFDSMKLKTGFDSNSSEAVSDAKAQYDDTDNHEQLRMNVEKYQRIVSEHFKTQPYEKEVKRICV